MLIAMRNAMMTGRRLPYDAEVEYLESTGTQWIDTGVDKGMGTKVKMKFMLPSTNPNSVFLFGMIYRPQSTVYRFALQVNGRLYMVYPYTGTGTSTSVRFSCNVQYDIELDSAGHFTMNGMEYSVQGSENFSTEEEIYLFARHNVMNNVPDGLGGLFRIYSFQIYDGATIVRDFIPVRIGTEGAMFDRANPTMGMNPDGSARNDGLYRNRGTGAFIIGSDVVASNGGGISANA